VRWQNKETSQAALQAAEQDQTMSALMQMLDPGFGEMNHITVVHGYARK
jgi:hypothetical protein